MTKGEGTISIFRRKRIGRLPASGKYFIRIQEGIELFLEVALDAISEGHIEDAERAEYNDTVTCRTTVMADGHVI